ncbi:MAG: hypothetical protein ACYDAD_07360 [Acidimicrobiales bacterium]
MEDRFGAGLYLEMTDMDAADYRSRRVPLVSARPGVSRAGWWANVCPGRSDLPRRMAECSLLGTYEVDDSFEPPPPGPGVAGLHFLRTARPGQGRLTGRPTIGLSVVLISPRRAGDAQALRDWGDFVHISHIAATANPGYTMITPYENATGGDPRFLHLYEMDTEDPEAAFQAMTPRVEDRLGGGAGTADFDAWAWHPALRIMYVNTFRRLGESVAG